MLEISILRVPSSFCGYSSVKLNDNNNNYIFCYVSNSCGLNWEIIFNLQCGVRSRCSKFKFQQQGWYLKLLVLCNFFCKWTWFWKATHLAQKEGHLYWIQEVQHLPLENLINTFVKFGDVSWHSNAIRRKTDKKPPKVAELPHRW